MTDQAEFRWVADDPDPDKGPDTRVHAMSAQGSMVHVSTSNPDVGNRDIYITRDTFTALARAWLDHLGAK